MILFSIIFQSFHICKELNHRSKFWFYPYERTIDYFLEHLIDLNELTSLIIYSTLQYYPLYVPFVWNLCLITVHKRKCISWYRTWWQWKIRSSKWSLLSRHHLNHRHLLWYQVTVLSVGTNVWYQLSLHWKIISFLKIFNQELAEFFGKTSGRVSSFKY